MATTRLYLDCRSKAKDGKGNVIITLSHNYSVTSFPTGVRLHPCQWNGSRVIKHPNADTLNTLLADKKLKIDKAIALYQFENQDFDYVSASDIKANVLGTVSGNSRNHLISDLFNEYMGKNLKEGTRDIYRATLKKITGFAGNSAVIEDANIRWLYDFENYLSRTQGPNGRAIFLRCLRAVCKYATNLRIIPICPFDNFKIRSEPTSKRCIPVEQFRDFIDFRTTPTNSRYRDYFLLSFFLIGINVKDLLLAKRSQVVDGRLEYIREKTHKLYSVKIEPEAQMLIDKYAGENYLLKAMDKCKNYRSFAREINEGCQRIGSVAEVNDDIFGEPRKVIQPVIPGITTYWARHSWATFANEIGVPIDVISQALGHSMGNRTTLIYIKPDQSKVDEANRRVIDYALSGSSYSSSSLR